MKKKTMYFLSLLPVVSLVFPAFVFAALPVEPTATLTAFPNPVNLNSGSIISGITKLTWSSTNADTCVVTEGEKSGFDTGGATSGTDNSDALSAATTFAISCTGFGGTVAASVVVGVIPGSPDTDPPTATLTASPSTVDSGDHTTLTWSSTNATSCSVTEGSSSGFSTGGNTSGSDNSSSLGDTTTFAIRCTGTDGAVVASKTVHVNSGDDDDDDDTGGGGGGGGSGSGGGGSSNNSLIIMLMERLIDLLKQYLQLLLAARGQ